MVGRGLRWCAAQPKKKICFFKDYLTQKNVENPLSWFFQADSVSLDSVPFISANHGKHSVIFSIPICYATCSRGPNTFTISCFWIVHVWLSFSDKFLTRCNNYGLKEIQIDFFPKNSRRFVSKILGFYFACQLINYCFTDAGWRYKIPRSETEDLATHCIQAEWASCWYLFLMPFKTHEGSMKGPIWSLHIVGLRVNWNLPLLQWGRASLLFVWEKILPWYYLLSLLIANSTQKMVG